jgi:predicted Rossmann fold nucleotide-binding protein DprA/Smf involved in DNA uptake
MEASTGVPATAIQLDAENPLYPSHLDDRPRITAIGNLELLRESSIGLFCSVRCPGQLVNETYVLAHRLRDAGVAVIGGFHSPMERECLRLLLTGSQPVIICPARDIHDYRVPGEWRVGIEAGRILVVSPFGLDEHRVTSELARRRNRFVAALASEVFIAYAAPESSTMQFAADIATQRKPILTHGALENAPLLAMGARAITDADYPPRTALGQMPLFDG